MSIDANVQIYGGHSLVETDLTLKQLYFGFNISYWFGSIIVEAKHSRERESSLAFVRIY